MSQTFRGRVRRAYDLEGIRALLLEDGYEGDIGGGDWVEVALRDGRRARAEVTHVAYGSAFRAETPPMTLLVRGLDAEAPEPGAEVVTVAGEGDP